jgi:hypothetical protein
VKALAPHALQILFRLRTGAESGGSKQYRKQQWRV